MAGIDPAGACKASARGYQQAACGMDHAPRGRTSAVWFQAITQAVMQLVYKKTVTFRPGPCSTSYHSRPHYLFTALISIQLNLSTLASRLSPGNTSVTMPSSYAASELCSAIDGLKAKAQACQAHADSINLINMALFLAGQGPVPLSVQ